MDPRNSEELKQNYNVLEIALASKKAYLPTYEEYLKSADYKYFKDIIPYDQNGSGSCVAQACAMATTINN
ncbi:MAG: hypothetical protein PHY08_10145 [Candidatus Cloacimonetes bacterium]|nr:hypothetical protein [Candidatus Cloacimonadota bacterium]